MKHLLVRVADFHNAAPYTLRVTFDDGTAQTIDFEPVLYGHYYGPLRDLELFNKALNAASILESLRPFASIL